MSKNIYISSVRPVRFTRKDGTEGTDMQRVEFEAFQTLTKVTYDILKSTDPAQTYIDWLTKQRILLVVAGNRRGCSYIDPYTQHAKEFKEWLLRVEAEGFTVQYDMV